MFGYPALFVRGNLVTGLSKGYAVLPPDVVAHDSKLDRWLERAIAYGRTLPAK